MQQTVYHTPTPSRTTPETPHTRTYPSRTRPGLTHTVTIHEDGTVLCSCEAGRNSRECWHADNAVLTSRPAPARPTTPRRPWEDELDCIRRELAVSA